MIHLGENFLFKWKSYGYFWTFYNAFSCNFEEEQYTIVHDCNIFNKYYMTAIYLKNIFQQSNTHDTPS